MFKKILLAVVLGACAVFGGQQGKADDHVRGYYRANGTYVAPYYRTHADHNFYNNYSTYPNINPYTGKMGTRVIPPYSPRVAYPLPSYSPSRGYSPNRSYSPSHGRPK